MAAVHKGGAYATPSGDTDFRRDFNPEEAAARAAEKEASDKAERKARYEAKVAGKKYVRQPTGAEAFASARREALDFSDRIGKTQLVPAGAGQGKRGLSAGFYCKTCDLTFKDNLQFLEHLNSQQHGLATGVSNQRKRAKPEEVRARILELVKKRQELAEEMVTSLNDRLKVRKKEAEKEAEDKKRRRKKLNVRKKAEREEAEKAKVDYGEDVRIEGEHEEEDMMAQMGFAGFGTSKK